MSVRFTQFLRPDGKKQTIYIDLDEATEDKAKQIILNGYEFEAEELMNGMVSFTVSDGDQDVAHEISVNGPPVIPAVTKLINEFYERNSGVNSNT